MKLLELFKGTGSVGKQAKKMGFEVIGLDLEPHYTPDIETDILDWDYKKWANENNYTPDMIWASPPCNTFSPLAYRLKERDTKTAKPTSERAKLGTKILYKTLEIIDYFRRKNPKLLFVIENPRGMMRMDAKMMKLAKETTLYCIYGDFKRKPTDFFNNFPDGLGLKVDTQCPKGADIKRVQDLSLEQRYSIPSSLIKKILGEFKTQYGKKIGAGIETDRFDESGIVSLPEFRSVKINLPTYMIKRMPDIKGNPPPYRYRLVIPITKSRNISTRLQQTSLDINQKPVANPMVDVKEIENPPRLNEFSPSDRAKIKAYYNKVKANEAKNPDEIEKDPYEVVERGRPLPCPSPSALGGAKKVVAKEPKAKVVEPKAVEPKAKVVEPKAVEPKTKSREERLAEYLKDPELYTKKFIGKGLENNISTSSKKMPNKWIEYVKSYCTKTGMSYRDALKDPKCKAGYKKGGMIPSPLVAIAYNDSELGANAGKKFISL